jgi:hypothetical protein
MIKDITNRILLEDWDRGDEITVVEMGGLEVAYEQVITALAMEFLRCMEANPFQHEDLMLKWDECEEVRKLWHDYVNSMTSDHRVQKIANKFNGYTEAQEAAALNMARVFHRRGYVDAMNSVPTERHTKTHKWKD